MKKIIFLSAIVTFVAILPAQTISQIDKYWIFFTDKVSLNRLSKTQRYDLITERARFRRLRVSDAQHLVDYTDLPLDRAWIDSLKKSNITIVHRSKWFNAVSAYLSGSQRDLLRQKPFIERIEPVSVFRRFPVKDNQLLKSPPVGDLFDDIDPSYGYSYKQNALSQVPQVHELGFTGQDVLIGVFDSGFRLNHEAFADINVLAAYDFVHQDDNVDYDPDQDIASQISHGTKVLSIVAGYRLNKLIGPAYSSSYLLAKTEDVSSETRIEEDFWIAAAEWADSLGADIITSSVGYNDWYSYSDMDGNTALITRAADLAVKKGIIVVTSAGNERQDPWKYIIAPADGDSVIAAGSVDQNSDIAYFSSSGPTADGRIKPDVVAMGVQDYSVNVPLDTTRISERYTYISGTSASAPIIAGICALILCAHPELSPIQVREALVRTATQADQPDNDYGYGIAQALKAVYYHGDPMGIPSRTDLIDGFPNPVIRGRDKAFTLLLDVQSTLRVTLNIYNILGQRVRALFDGMLEPGGSQPVRWDLYDGSGYPVSAGIYVIKIEIGDKTINQKITVL
jgi:hypothetical protein